jgi:hypothetical protein
MTAWLSKGGGDRVSLVMGMDHHRAQISAEWIDAITGEISRARIAPADRMAVRKFLARFDGAELEVALEATTGWRFWSRRSSVSALRRTWPSRLRPAA